MRFSIGAWCQWNCERTLGLIIDSLPRPNERLQTYHVGNLLSKRINFFREIAMFVNFIFVRIHPFMGDAFVSSSLTLTFRSSVAKVPEILFKQKTRACTVANQKTAFSSLTECRNPQFHRSTEQIPAFQSKTNYVHTFHSAQMHARQHRLHAMCVSVYRHGSTFNERLLIFQVDINFLNPKTVRFLVQQNKEIKGLSAITVCNLVFFIVFRCSCVCVCVCLLDAQPHVWRVQN